MKRWIVLFLLLLSVSLLAGIQTIRYSYRSQVGLDSLRVDIRRDTTVAVIDSLDITSFPASGTISLDTRYWYEITTTPYWYGLSDTTYRTREIINLNAQTSLPTPDSSIGDSLVTVYIDVTKSFADLAGNMIPRNKLKLTLELLGAQVFTNGTLAILPTDSTLTPDSTGRATWQVPPTTILIPSWGKYRLSYVARDGRHTYSGVIRQFILDASTDPLNIMEATEAF